MSTTTYQRKDTIKFIFDRKFKRPKAMEVRQWLSEKVKINQGDIVGVFMSIMSPAVFVKLSSSDLCASIVEKFSGKLQFNHSDGHVGDVVVSFAGMGIRTVRIFELPFEIPAAEIDSVLGAYGKIISNVAETWSEPHMFPVLNGVRQIKMELQQHIPSFVDICGYKALIIYEGQPRTCALCQSTEHVRAKCPKRRVPQLSRDEGTSSGPVVQMKITYAKVAAPGTLMEQDIADQGDLIDFQEDGFSELYVRDAVEKTTISAQNVHEINSDKHVPQDSISGSGTSPLARDEPNTPPLLSAQSVTTSEQSDGAHSQVTENTVQEKEDWSNRETLDVTGITSNKGENDNSDVNNCKIAKEAEKGSFVNTSTVQVFKEDMGQGTTREDSMVTENDEDLRQEQLTSDLSEKSPDTSPERSRSPRKNRKRNKKRRLAHQNAERLAPPLRERLRVMREGEKADHQEEQERADDGSQMNTNVNDNDDKADEGTSGIGDLQRNAANTSWVDGMPAADLPMDATN